MRISALTSPWIVHGMLISQDILTLLTSLHAIHIRTVMLETLMFSLPNLVAVEARSSTLHTWVEVIVITAMASPWIVHGMLISQDTLTLLTFPPPSVCLKAVMLVELTFL